MIADVYTPFYNAMLDNAATIYAGISRKAAEEIRSRLTEALRAKGHKL